MRLTAPSGTSPKARFWQSVANEINARNSSQSAGMRTDVTSRGSHRTPVSSPYRRPSIYTVPFFEVTFKAFTQSGNSFLLPTQPADVTNGFLYGLHPGETPADLGESIPASSPYYQDSYAQSYRMESRRFKISWSNVGATGTIDTASMRIGVVYSFSRVTIKNILNQQPNGSFLLEAQSGWKTIGTNRVYSTSQFFQGSGYVRSALYIDAEIQAANGANLNQGGELVWIRRDTLERSLLMFQLLPGVVDQQGYTARTTKEPTAFYAEEFLDTTHPKLTFDAVDGSAENGSVEFELGEDHYNTVVATGAVYFLVHETFLSGTWRRNRGEPFTLRVDSI